MGCFNLSGGLSGLDIQYGDDVVLIPLVKTNKFSENIEVDTIHCSNDGAMQFFTPYSLPIRGRYNDYGGIKDIIMDEGALFIEKRFKMGISEFMELLLSGEAFDKSTIGCMFEHAEIYDSMVERELENNLAREKLPLSKGVLCNLGFKITDMPTNDERYGICLTHDNLDGVEIHSDGMWSKLKICNGVESLYTLKALDETLSEYNLGNLDYSSLGNKSEYEYYTEQALKYIQNVSKGMDDFLESMKNKTYSEYTDAEKLEFAELVRPFDSENLILFRNNNANRLFKCLGVNTISDVAKLLYFNRVMYDCNRLYFPSVGGSQTANFMTQKKLLELNEKILNNKISNG